MRHNKSRRSSFGLKPGPRRALIRGLAVSFVEHERIKTTLPRAWSVRRYVEKAITAGKSQNLSSRRLLLSRLSHSKTVSKIVDQLADRFKDRQGGCTRIIKLGRRKGDQAEMVYLEFVDYKPKTAVKTDEEKKSKETAAVKKADSVKKQQIQKKRKKHIRKMKQADRRKNRS